MPGVRRRGGCAARRRRRRGAPRRSWAARSPARRCAPPGAARRCSTAVAGRARARGRHPGRGAARRRRYGAALLLDGWALLAPAGPAGRPRRRCAGGWRPRPLVVRHTDGGRRCVVMADAGAAAGAGAGALGPGRARRRRARRPHRGRLPARGADGRDRGRRPAAPRSSTRSATAAASRPPDVEVLGPVELDPEPGADPAAPRGTSPGAGAAGAGPRARGGARRGGGPRSAARRPTGPGAPGPAGGRLIGRASGRRGAATTWRDERASRRGRMGRPAAPPRRRRHRCPTTRVHRPPGSRPRSGIRGRPRVEGDP